MDAQCNFIGVDDGRLFLPAPGCIARYSEILFVVYVQRGLQSSTLKVTKKGLCVVLGESLFFCVDDDHDDRFMTIEG